MIKSAFNLFRKQSGFSMVELLITMVIFVLTIAAATGIFVPLLTQFKQQSRMAETQIEGIVGLETLRRDIEHAGLGLPWSVPTAVVYEEAAGNPANYNDSPSNPPRAILSGNNVNFAGVVNGSDYLVIKATNVAVNDASTKWTDVTAVSGGARKVRYWGSSVEDLKPNIGDPAAGSDRVIVLIPSRGESNQRILVNNGALFTADFNQAPFPAEYSPSTPGDVYLIYGVDTQGPALKRPFNRADYFIRTGNAPARCAAGTGVLVKAGMRQADGNLDEMPLLDCVADMQAVYLLDMNEDGTVGTTANADGSFVSSSEGANTATVQATFNSASNLRNRVKEIRVYILAYEGQKDVNFTFTGFTVGACATCVRVGNEPLIPPASVRDFNLATIPDYQNYRWKVYTLAAKPRNLR